MIPKARGGVLNAARRTGVAIDEVPATTLPSGVEGTVDRKTRTGVDTGMISEAAVIVGRPGLRGEGAKTGAFSGAALFRMSGDLKPLIVFLFLAPMADDGWKGVENSDVDACERPRAGPAVSSGLPCTSEFSTATRTGRGGEIGDVFICGRIASSVSAWSASASQSFIRTSACCIAVSEGMIALFIAAVVKMTVEGTSGMMLARAALPLRNPMGPVGIVEENHEE